MPPGPTPPMPPPPPPPQVAGSGGVMAASRIRARARWAAVRRMTENSLGAGRKLYAAPRRGGGSARQRIQGLGIDPQQLRRLGGEVARVLAPLRKLREDGE